LNSTKKIIVFLGAPGSGKGALSRLCIESFGWKQLSTGNLCRKHVSEGTPLGQQIDFALKSGTLVSDDVIIDMGKQWIEQEIQNTDALILDGFPRTVVQATGFLKFFDENYAQVKLVIVELRVPDHEIIERLSARLVCSDKGCQAVFSARIEKLKSRIEGVCDFCASPLIQRNDDKAEVVAARLATYHLHCEKLTSFYKNAGYVVHVIDGNRGSLEVFESFLKHVGTT
jgi:adenylate kinase